MGSNTPDTSTFPWLRDVSMNNLAIGTIWFRDGTSLSSLNDIRLLTADGALTYTYKVDTNTTDLDITRTQPTGVFHFNNSDQESATNIFIYPGKKIKSIDGLITNFHLPQSSLFLLICALIGTKTALDMYNYAIENKYRFYSYGDACFLLNKNYG